MLPSLENLCTRICRIKLLFICSALSLGTFFRMETSGQDWRLACCSGNLIQPSCRIHLSELLPMLDGYIPATGKSVDEILENFTMEMAPGQITLDEARQWFAVNVELLGPVSAQQVLWTLDGFSVAFYCQFQVACLVRLPNFPTRPVIILQSLMTILFLEHGSEKSFSQIYHKLGHCLVPPATNCAQFRLQACTIVRWRRLESHRHPYPHWYQLRGHHPNRNPLRP